MSDARRTAALLVDALRAIDAVRRFAAGRALQDYLGDEMLRAAVERQLIIVGEALAALRRDDPATAARIPMLNDAVGMRHILVHGYAVVTDTRVWSTVVDHLPALRESLAGLLPAAEV